MMSVPSYVVIWRYSLAISKNLPDVPASKRMVYVPVIFGLQKTAALLAQFHTSWKTTKKMSPGWVPFHWCLPHRGVVKWPCGSHGSKSQKWIPMDTLQETRKHIPPNGKRKIIDSKVPLGRDMRPFPRGYENMFWKGFSFIYLTMLPLPATVANTGLGWDHLVKKWCNIRSGHCYCEGELRINLVVNNIRSCNHSNNNTRQEIGVWPWNRVVSY